MINYGTLQSGQVADTPADGRHVATLHRAALVSTRSGDRLVTEWQSADASWTSWNRFDDTGLQYTIQLLDGLGIDRAQLTDDDTFKLELAGVEGKTFDVRTSSQTGSQGDRVLVSTYVDALARGAADADVPADTSDLKATGVVQQLAASDDDIPF